MESTWCGYKACEVMLLQIFPYTYILLKQAAVTVALLSSCTFNPASLPLVETEFFLQTFSTYITYSKMSLVAWAGHPFEMDFSFWKSQEPLGAKSGECGEGVSVQFFFMYMLLDSTRSDGVTMKEPVVGAELRPFLWTPSCSLSSICT